MRAREKELDKLVAVAVDNLVKTFGEIKKQFASAKKEEVDCFGAAEVIAASRAKFKHLPLLRNPFSTIVGTPNEFGHLYVS